MFARKVFWVKDHRVLISFKKEIHRWYIDDLFTVWHLEDLEEDSEQNNVPVVEMHELQSEFTVWKGRAMRSKERPAKLGPMTHGLYLKHCLGHQMGKDHRR